MKKLIWEKSKDSYGLDCYWLDTPFGEYYLEQWEKSDFVDCYGQTGSCGRHENMNPDKLVWMCRNTHFECKILKTIQEKIETHYRKLVSKALEQLSIGLVLHEDEI